MNNLEFAQTINDAAQDLVDYDNAFWCEFPKDDDVYVIEVLKLIDNLRQALKGKEGRI